MNRRIDRWADDIQEQLSFPLPEGPAIVLSGDRAGELCR